MLGQPATILTHPDHIRHVLQKNYQNYDKQLFIFRAIANSLLGNGLLTNDGASWKHQRHLIGKQFHRQVLSGFVAKMVQQTSNLLGQWRNHAGSLDVLEEMQKLTLRITISALFSVESPEESLAIHHIFEQVWSSHAHFVKFPFPPLAVPIPRNLRVRRAARQLDQITYAMIEQHRTAPPATPDLLSLLLAAGDMPDQQIRDELLTLFAGGHETTASTLAWIWYMLHTHPEVQERLFCEVDDVLHGKPPAIEDVPRLRYTRMIIDETLRLFPASFALVRRAVKEDEVGGYVIPARSIVFVSPYCAHRHPDFWPDPERFDPERFAPEQSPEQAERLKRAYFPFGAGPRICIGKDFALMESVIIVAMIAQRYQLHVHPDHPVEPWVGLTMRPRHALPMTLEARRG